MHSERLAVCFLHFLLRVLCGKSQIHDTLQWGKTARSPVFGACPAGVVRCRGAGYGLGQHFRVCRWLSGLQEGKGWCRSLHLCLLWRWNGAARGRHRKPALCRRLGGGWPCSVPWRSLWRVPQPHRVTGTGRQSPRSPGRAAAGARRGEEVTVPMAQRCGSCAVCATGGSCWPRGREGRSRSVCERERSCYVCEGSRGVRVEPIPGRAAPVARV